MSNNEATQKKMAPPYVPWRTFINFLDNMKAIGLPSHIDRSVMSSMSGGMRYWLLSSLRAMSLIDKEDAPSAELRNLVNADSEQRKDMFLTIFETIYDFLSDDSFDISQTTPEKLNKALERAGATGATTAKSRAFFILLGKAAGVQMSPHLKKISRLSTARKSKSTQKKKKAKSQPQTGGTDDSGNIAKTDLDMLWSIYDINTMNDEEQAAVMTLLKYLKKKEGTN